MELVRRAARSAAAREAVGFLGATYLRLVGATNTFRSEPADPYAEYSLEMPAIVATWHGQHFLSHMARRAGDRVASLVSRSSDGDLNASVLKRLNVRSIRGSGARGRAQRGGAPALREMLRALADGESIVMTADIPKISRSCGPGIVKLALLSGRPIVPLAVVTSRRIDFHSWDHASLGLPFGRGAMVFGPPITVARHETPEQLEQTRSAVEASLNAVHERAYNMLGDRDPGART